MKDMLKTVGEAAVVMAVATAGCYFLDADLTGVIAVYALLVAIGAERRAKRCEP